MGAIPVELFPFLIDNGFDSGDINSRAEMGRSALHVAIRMDEVKTALRILKLEAFKMDSLDDHGWTVLHYAAMRGMPTVCDAILKRDDFTQALKRDPMGRSALLLAAYWGRPDAFKFLLEYGFDPDSTDTYGQCCAHLAAIDGYIDEHIQVIEEFLEKGGLEASKRPDNLGQTAMGLAQELEHNDLYQVLLTGKRRERPPPAPKEEEEDEEIELTFEDDAWRNRYFEGTDEEPSPKQKYCLKPDKFRLLVSQTGNLAATLRFTQKEVAKHHHQDESSPPRSAATKDESSPDKVGQLEAVIAEDAANDEAAQAEDAANDEAAQAEAKRKKQVEDLRNKARNSFTAGVEAEKLEAAQAEAQRKKQVEDVREKARNSFTGGVNAGQLEAAHAEATASQKVEDQKKQETEDQKKQDNIFFTREDETDPSPVKASD